jgi:predicted O-linked N-acetylglucosamine transferase (SPINDLY family)
MTMPYTLLPASGADQVSEWIRLGSEAYALNNLKSAQKYYNRATRLDPSHAIAINNLGIVLAASGNVPEALLTIERAALFDGVEPIIAANWALVNFEADRIEEARAAAEHAIKLAGDAPSDPEANETKTAGYVRSRLAFAVIASAYGQPGDAIPAYRQMLAVEPKNQAAGPNCCFNQTLVDIAPAELLAQRKVWYESNRWKGPLWPHKNDKTPGRTLKVGYIGGDFKSHSAAMIYAQVLLNHDKQQVSPYLYSTLPTDAEKDDMTQMLRDCGQWRDVFGKSDEEIEDQISKDEIDILVDLAAHTNGGKLAVFTRKPAPIQITAWGFAHGTGLPEMDYFFADPIAVPVEERTPDNYSEKIYDLPCIVTYRPPDEYAIPPSSPAPCQKNDYFTFGAFSRFEKLSNEYLACIREILLRVPDSRLYLKDAAYRRPYAIRRIMKALDGIDRGRLKFGLATSHPEHILEYQKLDLLLDPWPHGAGNVTLETLYAGVPLITRYGRQPSGRTASSVLTVMGRTDWIARSDAEYVAKAVEWAGRRDELAKARVTLREELVGSPVIKGYAGEVEKAYRAMWKEWCAK